MVMSIAAVSSIRGDDAAPHGFKKTEIGLVPVDWEVRRIGGEIDLLTGFPFPSKKYVPHGIRLLRGSNIKGGEVDWSKETTRYWREVTFELEHYLLGEGDIVIAMDGSLVGKSFARLSRNDVPALLVQRVARIRSDSIIVGYLKEWVCSEYFTKYCDSVKTVTAIPHISPSDIRNFLIPIPPTREEQSNIASSLSDADALIESLDKLIAKKRAVKVATIQQLVTAKRRLPGFTKPWEHKLLGEIGEFAKGQGIKADDVTDDGFACVRYGELYTRYRNYFTRAVSRIPSKVAAQAPRIRKGDLLFPASGETAEEIGVCAAYLGEEDA